MDETARDFEALILRARENDPEAVRELHDRYSDAVRRVVRRRLDERLRRRYDSTDFVQSVWLAFLQLPSDRYLFRTPEDLVAFLSRMAANRVIDVTRQKLGTRKEDIARETPLDCIVGDNGRPLAEILTGPTPTASQMFIADERWQELIRGLPPGQRRVLELLRDGHSQTEICDRLGIHRKVIQRLLSRLQEACDRS